MSSQITPKTTAASGLFGVTATTSSTTTFAPTSSTTTGGLFGVTSTSTTTTASGGLLFGIKTTSSATPGLFSGSTMTGSLFGAKTTLPSLFESTTAISTATTMTTAPSLGLGGTTHHSGLSTISGVGTATAGTTSEKENWREGIVPKPIREVVLQIREKIKENKKLTEEFNSASNDGTIKVKERLKEVEHRLYEAYSRTVECDLKCAQLSGRVAKDVQLGDIAQRVQESVSKNIHFSSHTQIIQYIVDIIREYDDAVIWYQNTIEDIEMKLTAMLSGKGSLTVNDLKEMLTRFDIAFSRVAIKLFDASRKVQDVKSVLTADGAMYMLRDALNRRMDASSRMQSFGSLRGNDFVPSQSVIAELGKQLKPAAGTTHPTTGTGLFGSTTSGTLFGSNAAAAKPFSFATTSSGGTSLFPSLTTTTVTPLFSSLTSTTSTASKPALCFGSTITNNSSGLLFSSKK
ncbi:hypothetical protein DICVIV_10665 [Dictyocaulus viviparus]|uniref:Nucleoporin p58/p45 n=1 Tax=Dictyocaulus viviparus TaxID=29172 RepID=A0A0D8XLR6_DICVI|nr:hypothetical protein DICVIV_10665 [Dictyocaulus viviparus]